MGHVCGSTVKWITLNDSEYFAWVLYDEYILNSIFISDVTDYLQLSMVQVVYFPHSLSGILFQISEN